ncbi:MAG: tyrosine-type recombinase/integrase [Anaerolineae bacterium]|nr:tyrosine-type recombinase/integrase [Anaerolineae bacterium]
MEGKSPRTTSWYEQKLKTFVAFCDDPPVGELTLEDARQFVVGLWDKDITAQTIHGYVRTLKAFASWLEREGYTSDNRFKKLKPPKVPKKLVQVLNEEEIKTILNSFNQDTQLGARAYAICVLFLDTGIRSGELCGITLDDVDFKRGVIKVNGKGAKERIVPFGNMAKKALMRYTRVFRPEPAMGAIDNLFLSTDGYPLTVNAIAKIMRRVAQRTGVERLHTHLWRHTSAVRYLMAGGDVFSLQTILGHETLEMTRHYVQLASRHIEIQHKRFSPADNLGLRRR